MTPQFWQEVQNSLNKIQLVQQSHKYKDHRFRVTILLSFILFQSDYARLLEEVRAELDALLRQSALVSAVMTTCHYQFDSTPY